MVNVGPIDIINSNEIPVLGFIWHLILWYDVKGHRAGPNEEDLLVWLKRMLPEHGDINGFTTGWHDGKQLAALIDTLKPRALPVDRPANPLILTKLCIQTASE